MKKNWKTTVVGILTILAVLAKAGVGVLSGEGVDLQEIITILMGGGLGVGLCAAADGSAKKAMCVLLSLGILLGGASGCITVRTIDEQGNEVVTTKTDTEALLLYIQLAQIVAESPIAQQLMDRLLDLMAEPEAENKEDQMLAWMQEAREWLEMYQANKQTPVIEGQ